jgi:addiction module RelE/StbE family toxin
VRRSLRRSAAFVRAAKRLVKKRPQAAAILRAALLQLEEDAFHPALRTHKLSGELDGAWACSVAYDLRIVFEVVQEGEVETILLLSIGTHDEVY